MVANLRDNGAIITGKTNTPEFGAGANTRPDVKSTAAISFITSRLWAPTRIVDPIFISVYLTLRSRPSGLPSESKAQALPRRVAVSKRARAV